MQYIRRVVPTSSDCPTVPILSGQYRFEGLCLESRLYLSRRARVYMQQLLNYNGRGDVSSAPANAALGAIINFTRTYVRIYLYVALAR